MKLKSESGSIMPMIIGFAALAIALIITVANAASLYLERKRLLSAADAASLAAAESFGYAQLSYRKGELQQHFDQGQINAAVLERLAKAQTQEKLTALRLDNVYSDERGAGVSISSKWSPVLIGPLFPEGFRIEASSYARGRFSNSD